MSPASRLAAAVALSLAACSFEPTVPPKARIACVDSSECVDGFTCEGGACIEVSRVATLARVKGVPATSADAARLGERMVISFELENPGEVTPTLVVNTTKQLVVACTRVEGTSRFECAFEPKGDELGEGETAGTIDYEIELDGGRRDVKRGSLRFDFTPVLDAVDYADTVLSTAQRRFTVKIKVLNDALATPAVQLRFSTPVRAACTKIAAEPHQYGCEGEISDSAVGATKTGRAWFDVELREGLTFRNAGLAPYDFEMPSILAGSPALTFEETGKPDVVLAYTEANATSVKGTLRFFVSEPIASAKVLLTPPQRGPAFPRSPELTGTLAGVAGVTVPLVFGDLSGVPLDRYTFTATATITDTAGNVAKDLPITFPAGGPQAVVLNTEKPAAPVDPALVQVLRSPWGASNELVFANGTKRQRPCGIDASSGGCTIVAGAAGAALPGRIIVAKGEATGRAELARGTVEADGSFTIFLDGDKPRVFLQQVNGSGRGSDVKAPVHRWLASPGGKVAGSDAENATTLTLVPTRAPSLDLGPDASEATSPQYNGLVSPADSNTTSVSGSGHWTNRTPTAGPSGRSSATMTRDPTTGRLILFGGSPALFGGGTIDATNEVWRFDPRRLRWSVATPPVGPIRRRDPAIQFDPIRGRSLLFGNNRLVPGGAANDPGPDAWGWDDRAGEWRREEIVLADPDTRNNSLTWSDFPGSDSGFPLLFDDGGGTRTPGFVAFAAFTGGVTDPNYTLDFWRFADRRWTSPRVTGAPPARRYAAVAIDHVRGRAYVVGGCQTLAGGALKALKDAWSLDLVTNVWTRLPDSDLPRCGGLAYITPDSKNLVLVGGHRDTLSALPLNYEFQYSDAAFDLEASTWGAKFEPIFPIRAYAAGAWSPELQRFVVFGGLGVDGRKLGDTWMGERGNWTELTTEAAPPIYEAAGGGGVLFTRRTPEALSSTPEGAARNETWVWPGNERRWVRRAIQPDFSGFLRSVWDGAGNRALFVVRNTAGLGAWQWTVADGFKLLLHIAAGSTDPMPNNFKDFQLAYDKDAHRIILHGGRRSDGFAINDTWMLYDGGTYWQFANQNGVGPVCVSGAMAYVTLAAQRGTWLLCGESATGVRAGTIHKFENQAWTNVTATGEPSTGEGAWTDLGDGSLLLVGTTTSGAPLTPKRFTLADKTFRDFTPTIGATPPIARAAALVANAAGTKVYALGRGVSPNTFGAWTIDRTAGTWKFTDRPAAYAAFKQVAPAGLIDPEAGRGVIVGDTIDNPSFAAGRHPELDGLVLGVRFATDAWSDESITPPARYDYAMTSRTYGSPMLYGGRAGDARFTETWEFDGERWKRLSQAGPASVTTGPTGLPPPTMVPWVAFTEPLQRGAAMTIGNKLYTWNDDAPGWTARPDLPWPATTPFGLFLDFPNGRLAAFQGASGDLVLTPGPAATWTLGATSWTSDTKGGPPALAPLATAMSFTRPIAFGPTSYNETDLPVFERLSCGWRRVDTAVHLRPSQRFEFASMTDAGPTEALVVGGRAGRPGSPGDALSETWAWDSGSNDYPGLVWTVPWAAALLKDTPSGVTIHVAGEAKRTDGCTPTVDVPQALQLRVSVWNWATSAWVVWPDADGDARVGPFHRFRPPSGAILSQYLHGAGRELTVAVEPARTPTELDPDEGANRTGFSQMAVDAIAAEVEVTPAP